jgi:hypothetical protein
VAKRQRSRQRAEGVARGGPDAGIADRAAEPVARTAAERIEAQPRECARSRATVENAPTSIARRGKRRYTLRVHPLTSTRFDIVKSALADIVVRLAEAAQTDAISVLRTRAADYERVVASWEYLHPTEEERASVMSEVLELNLAVMRVGAAG